MQPMSIPTPDSTSIAEEPATAATVEIPTSYNAAPTEGEERQSQDVQAEPQHEPVPAPKKRGRKRKKTPEQPSGSADTSTETGTNGQTSAQYNQAAAIPQPQNNVSIILDAPNNGPESNDNNPPVTEQISEPALNPESYAGERSFETPRKQQNQLPSTKGQPKADQDTSTTGSPNNNKGPSKHSPIAGTSKVPYRVGLSRRARIAPLLKIIRR